MSAGWKKKKLFLFFNSVTQPLIGSAINSARDKIKWLTAQKIPMNIKGKIFFWSSWNNPRVIKIAKNSHTAKEIPTWKKKISQKKKKKFLPLQKVFLSYLLFLFLEELGAKQPKKLYSKTVFFFLLKNFKKVKFLPFPGQPSTWPLEQFAQKNFLRKFQYWSARLLSGSFFGKEQKKNFFIHVFTSKKKNFFLHTPRCLQSTRQIFLPRGSQRAPQTQQKLQTQMRLQILELDLEEFSRKFLRPFRLRKKKNNRKKRRFFCTHWDDNK